MSNALPHKNAAGEASAPGNESAPGGAAAPEDVGYLLHVFHRAENGRDVICGVGKLQNGQTFQFTDDRVSPTLYVRVSEQRELDARIRSDGISARVVPSEYTTMDGEPVAGIQFERVRDQRNLVKSLEVQQTRTYEGDIPFARQYLIGRGLRGGVKISGAWISGDRVDRVYANPELQPEYWEPAFSVLALDIETDPEATTIYAVGLVLSGSDGGIEAVEIHMVGEPADGDPPHLVCWADEASMLRGLSSRVLEMDPDLITGWNLVDFDLQVLQRRFRDLNVPFQLGRTDDQSWYRSGEIWGGSTMVIHGRQILDALHLLRGTLQRFEDYRLDTVANAILGRGKLLEDDEGSSRAEKITEVYREDRATFCAYCLEDARLVLDILEAEGLINLTLRRGLLTGLPLERAWVSVAAFDNIYINALHQRGMVAPTTGVDRTPGAGAPGGLIIPAKAGLYRNVFVFDFKSLYPSIIRTYNIDPLAHIQGQQAASDETGTVPGRVSDGVPGRVSGAEPGRVSDGDQPGSIIEAPNGARFSRTPGILPSMLEQFFKRREEARTTGDELASYTYKIVMNSFYGVLASASCRFAAPQLAGAITEFGHYILKWCRDELEKDGYKVLYGDTDSVFVDLDPADSPESDQATDMGRKVCDRINARLAAHVRERYGVASFLELELEKCYHRFLLPSMRGDVERGRAKGYAGLRRGTDGDRVEIVGMEAVRRDWTDLAHRLQGVLLDRVFHDVPGNEIEEEIYHWVQEVRSGRRDELLVYRKNLRKPVESYTRSVPPHVKAARLMENPTGVIRYVITLDGPQPEDRIMAPIDYGHYVEKQIRPIVTTVAHAYELDVEAAMSGRLSLFGNTLSTQQYPSGTSEVSP
ncbi:MAG: DNA polymerase II [Gemmatimonadetes bacterium]|nr:DNA polymerase II [Gemmatimonadota bacterium]MYG86147.1 DNA polymerase II [Gemmatimonadota bacterium]MYJ90353.1 DNA polymerase II [Gemmatimonadota bacterium]